MLTQYDNNNINSQSTDFLDNNSLEDNLSLNADFNNQQNQLDKNEEGFYEEKLKRIKIILIILQKFLKKIIQQMLKKMHLMIIKQIV